MPTSPAPRSVKHAAETLNNDSTSPSTLSATQNNKKKTKSSRIDQELYELEHNDGNRHSKELMLCLNKYAQTVDDLHEKNRQLEKKLALNDHVARHDPNANKVTAEKLSSLELQGNNVLHRLKLEQNELAQLTTLIQSHELLLTQQKPKLVELAELDRNHAVLLGRVRKLKHELDRRIVNMNEKLNRNRHLREVIDEHRAERVRMDEMYTKMAIEMMAKTHKIAKVSGDVEILRQEIATIEHDMESVRLEGEEWAARCDRRAADLLEKLLHKNEAEASEKEAIGNPLSENDPFKQMLKAKASEDVCPIKSSKWKSGQAKVTMDALLAKYHENCMYLEKLYDASGTTTPSALIDAFNNQEADQFERIQQVNKLAEEIELHRQESTKMREEIGRLKQVKDTVNFQRVNRVEELRAKLESTKEQRKVKEDANGKLQTFLDTIKPAILQFHARIGCPDVHTEDMKQVLSDIEGHLVTVLQAYHTKVESAKKEEVLSQTFASLSPAKRRSSIAMGARTRRSTTVHKKSAEDLSGVRVKSAAVLPNLGSDMHSKAMLKPPLQGTVDDGIKASAAGNVNALVSKKQPYRYAHLRPPHLSVDELRKHDDVEEDYPLTYHELKAKAWHSDTIE